MKSTRRSKKTCAPRRRFDSCLFAAVLVLLWLSAGCSHYGYVDQNASDKPNASDEQVASDEQDPALATVSVWTVAAPAGEGLDQARLTRTLVEAIRQRGVDASWQADPTSLSANGVSANGVSVRCSVSNTEVDGFGRSLFARTQVLCRVGGPKDLATPDEPAEQFEASGRYTAAISGGVSAIAPTRSEVQEAAAVDALGRVADPIAQFVLQTYR